MKAVYSNSDSSWIITKVMSIIHWICNHWISEKLYKRVLQESSHAKMIFRKILFLAKVFVITEAGYPRTRSSYRADFNAERAERAMMKLLDTWSNSFSNDQKMIEQKRNRACVYLKEFQIQRPYLCAWVLRLNTNKIK